MPCKQIYLSNFPCFSFTHATSALSSFSSESWNLACFLFWGEITFFDDEMSDACVCFEGLPWTMVSIGIFAFRFCRLPLISLSTAMSWTSCSLSSVKLVWPKNGPWHQLWMPICWTKTIFVLSDLKYPMIEGSLAPCTSYAWCYSN